MKNNCKSSTNNRKRGTNSNNETPRRRAQTRNHEECGAKISRFCALWASSRGISMVFSKRFQGHQNIMQQLVFDHSGQKRQINCKFVFRTSKTAKRFNSRRPMNSSCGNNKREAASTTQTAEKSAKRDQKGRKWRRQDFTR